MPTVGVVGLGPVGSILAAHLADGGVDVVLEDVSEEVLTRIENEGLRISGIKQVSARVEKIASSLTELVEYDPDVVFIATKGCFLRNVLAELKPVYNSKMKVVSFQNGLDNECLIGEALGSTVAYRVVVNYAGSMVNPGNVRMNWFQPPNYVGAFRRGEYSTDGTTKQIARLMTMCNLKTEEASDIKRYVWEKTILNSALCSICALTGQTMKEAMEFAPSRDLTVRVLDEGLAVAKADGYNFGEDALERFTSYLEKGGAHKPSMLVDVENERITEVDFLSGAIARYGQRYRIQTPVNHVLTCLLKSLENRYSGSAHAQS